MIMRFIIVILIVVLLFILYGYLENYRFVITEYEISKENIPSELNGKRCICFSDLHNNSFGRNNQKLIDAIDRYSPEYIFIPGDCVNGLEDSENAIKLLSHLSRKYTVIAANGNHELQHQLFMPDKYERYCNTGIINLDNEKVVLFPKCEVYGLNIDLDFYNRINQPKFTQSYLTEKLGNCENECYNILIAHTPAYIKEYANAGFDLVFCGHYHGGFLRLPFVGGIISPQMKIFPKFSAGHYKVNECDIIVSRGLGSHTIPVRINNPPELIVINFNKRNEDYCG